MTWPLQVDMGLPQGPSVFKGMRHGVPSAYAITTRFGIKDTPGLLGDSAVVGSFDQDPELPGRLQVTFSGGGPPQAQRQRWCYDAACTSAAAAVHACAWPLLQAHRWIRDLKLGVQLPSSACMHAISLDDAGLLPAVWAALGTWARAREQCVGSVGTCARLYVNNQQQALQAKWPDAAALTAKRTEPLCPCCAT